MRVLATGIDYSTGRPLIPAMDEGTFECNADEITRVKAESTRGVSSIRDRRRE
jgi:hypothetical protein